MYVYMCGFLYGARSSLCAYACMDVCVCLYVITLYVCHPVSMLAIACLCIRTCMHVCVYACMHAWTYVRLPMSICLCGCVMRVVYIQPYHDVCMCMCKCVCVVCVRYVCVFVDVFVHAQTARLIGWCFFVNPQSVDTRTTPNNNQTPCWPGSEERKNTKPFLNGGQKSPNPFWTGPKKAPNPF